jgi:hypothetical protein
LPRLLPTAATAQPPLALTTPPITFSLHVPPHGKNNIYLIPCRISNFPPDIEQSGSRKTQQSKNQTDTHKTSTKSHIAHFCPIAGVPRLTDGNILKRAIAWERKN